MTARVILVSGPLEINRLNLHIVSPSDVTEKDIKWWQSWTYPEAASPAEKLSRLEMALMSLKYNINESEIGYSPEQ